MLKKKKPAMTTATKPLFHIVGIGASAGGLEALSRLLSKLPPRTGMAFVVVQHLDPTRASLLAQILQKETAMPVKEAVDGARIAPDHVYVIPPNTHMCIHKDALKLIPRPEGVQALAVNCFLYSLAEERGNKAIAVILSGSASDGALGVKAIKAEGGLVFAQDEKSSGHFGMPQSAAATGVVDFVLPPEKIAAELADMASHPALSPDLAAVFEDSETLGQIFNLVRRATGVDFSLYKPSTIRRRLLRRLMLHKIADLAAFKALLDMDPEEVRALHDDLLIHVTHFFREPKAYAALRAKTFPRILKALPADAPIRVWVPGCSTGEEAYSLAIALLDYLSETDSMNPIQVFATDISDVALERARAGVYSEDIANFVPARQLRRFFTKVDRGYEIVKRVRDVCVFARQDLTKDPPFANVDLISCCNVLIYLSPAIQKQILPMFHYALRPSGALVLGAAETVGEFGDLFAVADKGGRIYWKKASASRMNYAARVQRPQLDEPAARAKAAARPAWPETDVQKVAERLLLARYAPAGVVVGGDMTVLHFRGHVARYLEPVTGRANLSLLKMVPAHVAGTLSSLVKKAKKSDVAVSVGGVLLGEDDARRAAKITIEAIPFRLPVTGERYFIILFEDQAGAAAVGPRHPAAPPRAEPVSIKRLKSELASTRGYLQTIVEEHETVNEELKAANEEIISSNEELQTRNGDLGLLNNDLLNLISSVHLPIIMVSSDLRIRRFSPMAEKVMNLTPGDVGRLIGEIKPKFALPNIEEIIHEVIETVTSKELEVRDADGRSYSVRVRPYKTTENKIEGAVLLFIDSEPILRGIADLPAGAFEAFLEMGREPLTILDSHMRVRAGSRSMYQAHGLTQGGLGRPLFELDGGAGTRRSCAGRSRRWPRRAPRSRTCGRAPGTTTASSAPAGSRASETGRR
ncbi:MAG: PAS domain-containing protein [Elusimicrobiota bacterium]|nr:MAG: PAS domain-containing protein [Elusimicrobiota bacterium]